MPEKSYLLYIDYLLIFNLVIGQFIYFNFVDNKIFVLFQWIHFYFYLFNTHKYKKYNIFL